MGVGDHSAVHITSQLNKLIWHLTCRKPIERRIRLWKKVNVDGLGEEVRNFATTLKTTVQPTTSMDLAKEEVVKPS